MPDSIELTSEQQQQLTQQYNRLTMAVGKLSLHFSTIEFFTTRILVTLVDRQDSVVAEMVTQDFNISKRWELIRQIVSFLYRDKHLTGEIEACDEELGKLRPLRNLLIHGMWNTHPIELIAGNVTCMDMRWAKKSEGRWSRKKAESFTLHQLNELAVQVGHLQNRIMKLEALVQAATPLPFKMANGNES